MTTSFEFAERCAALAANLALAFAGEPEEKVTQSLAQMRTNLQTELAKAFAADVYVSTVVGLFVDAILTRKREIERGAGAAMGRAGRDVQSRQVQGASA
jgi:hypothetical protein